MDKFFCRKCNGTGMFMQQRGMQVGLYCDCCGAWFKWVGKKEQPIYKNRGLKLYPQNMEVTLKGTPSLGVEITPISDKSENLGVIGNNEVSTPAVDGPFGGSSKSHLTEPVNIEEEIERRVQERLKEITKQTNQKKMTSVEIDGDSDAYCSICDGNPLVAEEGNKVEVSIFSGVMTVTDTSGIEILGLYRLKKCPNCGKMF